MARAEHGVVGVGSADSPPQLPLTFFRRPGMTASAVVLVPLALAVLAFPFFIGSVDISSVGPPPTQ